MVAKLGTRPYESVAAWQRCTDGPGGKRARSLRLRSTAMTGRANTPGSRRRKLEVELDKALSNSVRQNLGEYLTL